MAEVERQGLLEQVEREEKVSILSWTTLMDPEAEAAMEAAATAIMPSLPRVEMAAIIKQAPATVLEMITLVLSMISPEPLAPMAVEEEAEEVG